MILIAHRGNINGRLSWYENRPDYVTETLSLGYDVEIDVWYVKNALYLGHDEPQYEIDYDFLRNPMLWIHCKNIEAMELLSGKWLNAFAHQDGLIITPNGYLWTAPGLPITSRSIAVMPEMVPNWNIVLACGVCTDYPVKYKT
jgi:hypothetical protein